MKMTKMKMMSREITYSKVDTPGTTSGICTPLRMGSPSWFPQSPGTVGYGPHPWRQFCKFYSRVATTGTTRTALPQEGPLPEPLLPSRPSLPPRFYPQPVCYLLNIVSLGQLQGIRARKRIINGEKNRRGSYSY